MSLREPRRPRRQGVWTSSRHSFGFASRCVARVQNNTPCGKHTVNILNVSSWWSPYNKTWVIHTYHEHTHTHSSTFYHIFCTTYKPIRYVIFWCFTRSLIPSIFTWVTFLVTTWQVNPVECCAWQVQLLRRQQAPVLPAELAVIVIAHAVDLWSRSSRSLAPGKFGVLVDLCWFMLIYVDLCWFMLI